MGYDFAAESHYSESSPAGHLHMGYGIERRVITCDKGPIYSQRT